ncbi:MAG: phosphotransferase, partial [Acidimicrobiales bacterium]
VKMAPSAAVTRLFVNLSDLGADEIGFYRDVRPMLTLEAPAPLGFEIDGPSKRFVLVLEDLAARGCTFGEVLAPVDVGSAEAVLDTLAALHGACWQAPQLDRLGWIRANSTDAMLPLVSTAVRAMGSRLAHRDPALAPAGGRAILRSYPSVARQLDAGPHTVLHGDPHPGNCYFVDGRAGLLDWQVIRRGNPLRDVGYFLVLALDPDTRRRHERPLLDRYRAALTAAGGPSLTADDAWTTYRRMAAYPYVASTFTAGLGGLQDDAVGLEGLRRAVIAIDDLDTAAGLGLEPAALRPRRWRTRR